MLKQHQQQVDMLACINLSISFNARKDLWCFGTEIPVFFLQEGLEELIQFCDLMATGRLEEILDSAKRAKHYAAIDLKHLLILLRKYRLASTVICSGPLMLTALSNMNAKSAVWRLLVCL